MILREDTNLLSLVADESEEDFDFGPRWKICQGDPNCLWDCQRLHVLVKFSSRSQLDLSEQTPSLARFPIYSSSDLGP